MKLIELIAMFRRGKSFNDFCRENQIDPESEVVEIYARVPVSLDSQLGFFPIEETGGRSEVSSDNVTYQNLFDFFYFLDVIKEAEVRPDLSDMTIASRIFSYAIKDA